jgi:hypothetical protein
VGVGDVLPDTCFISGVDPQPVALDVDPSFVEIEFMSEYEAHLGMSTQRTQSMIDQFLN